MSGARTTSAAGIPTTNAVQRMGVFRSYGLAGQWAMGGQLRRTGRRTARAIAPTTSEMATPTRVRSLTTATLVHPSTDPVCYPMDMCAPQSLSKPEGSLVAGSGGRVLTSWKECVALSN